jgi:hypothetical protein
MGHRPLPALRDLTRDGRWSTHDVSVRKKMGGKMRTNRTPTNLARLGHFSPASQAGRLAGPVFYVYVFSLVPIAQQDGLSAVLGRQSLGKCLWSRLNCIRAASKINMEATDVG